MRLVLFLFAALLLASGCNKRVAEVGGKPTKPVRNTEVAKLLRSVSDARVQTNFLEARTKVDLRSDKLDIGGTAIIRMEKGKAIWMVVKKLGFEGARALIRPDSFFLINRLQGDYIAEPLSYLEEKYKFPARFDLLEEIILGNAVFLTDDLRLRTEGDSYLLEGRSDKYAVRYEIDPLLLQPRQMTLDELAQSRGVDVRNADYQQLEGLERPFATERTVTVRGGSAGNASVKLTFDRVEFSGPLDMPFSFRR